MSTLKKVSSLAEIKELTTVPRLTYNYEAQLIDKTHLDSPEETVKLIRKFIDKGSIRSQEEFLLMMLDEENQCIGIFSLFKGIRGQVLVDHNLILTLLLSFGCETYVIAHTHPTSDYLPSPEDVEMTISLKHKTDYFHIDMKDHLIITEENHYSFQESFRIW